MGSVPDDAVALFRVVPERFVAERDELVKRLRADGREEDAAAVKALRRPTVVVWALNQLASRQPAELATLFEAGRALRAAQQAALTGTGGDAMLEATSDRRTAVRSLTAAAVGIIDESGGTGGTHADAIAAALEAASTDPAAGADLAAGTLRSAPVGGGDLGFGDLPSIAVVPGGGEERDEPRVDLARLRRERDAARRTATTKRTAADRLAKQVNDLAERLERVRSEHADAESSALEAELEAERAQRLLDDA